MYSETHAAEIFISFPGESSLDDVAMVLVGVPRDNGVIYNKVYSENHIAIVVCVSFFGVIGNLLP